jgi:hypothetical protein
VPVPLLSLQPDRSLAPAARRLAWLSYSGLLLAIFAFFDFVLLSIWGYGGDWSPLWIAGRLAWSDPAKLYDFALVTKLQLPILGDLGVRPYVYPPSTLALLAPLSLLPFWVSLACVSAGGALCLAFVSSRRETDRILLLLSPPVVFAAMIGQPTLLVAALIVGGLSQLKSNALRAGILLALAAMVKPTLLLMVPFGLVSGKHWRSIASGAATAFVAVLVSVLLFGAAPWLAWIEALTRFRLIFAASAPLYRNGITPYALAIRVGFAPDWIPWTMLPLAIVVTIAIFLRSDDWRKRLVAVVGGSLLFSPYAMNYELAALAPVVLTMRRERLYDLALPVIWGAALFANASLLGLVAIYLWAVFSTFRTTDSIADDRGMERGVDVPARQHDDGPLTRGGLAA